MVNLSIKFSLRTSTFVILGLLQVVLVGALFISDNSVERGESLVNVVLEELLFLILSVNQFF